MKSTPITRVVQQIQATLPPGVLLLAAAKTRSLAEVEEAIQAGIRLFGYNYVQEASPIIQALGARAEWHMIGHLQRNKAKTAVELFDMIETVDSLALAAQLDRHCAAAGKTLPILIEINSGREDNKSGVFPEAAEELVLHISALPHLRVQGLMTLGPLTGEPEQSRPYFRTTRRLYEHLGGLNLTNVSMQYLSMGMSGSYLVAIEEGANIVRLGTRLFGERSR